MSYFDKLCVAVFQFVVSAAGLQVSPVCARVDVSDNPYSLRVRMFIRATTSSIHTYRGYSCRGDNVDG